MSRVRRNGKQLLITLADYEEAVLESLIEQFISLLEGDHERATAEDSFARWEAELAAPGDVDRSDPVIARLFPPAYRDDPEATDEFRRLTESAQRRHKIEQAQTVLQSLQATNAGADPAVVRPLEIEAWLKTITALRLSLSVRLGIEDADDIEDLEELDEENPRSVMYGMYEWLGYFLEEILLKLD